jgi:hypothetical protein
MSCLGGSVKEGSRVDRFDRVFLYITAGAFWGYFILWIILGGQ